jgi:hypothetical protein
MPFSEKSSFPSMLYENRNNRYFFTNQGEIILGSAGLVAGNLGHRDFGGQVIHSTQNLFSINKKFS